MGIGPINPYSPSFYEGPPDPNYINNATDLMNQSISEKFGSDACVDNIGEYSSELLELIQQFYAAPNIHVAEAIFQKIQLALEETNPSSQQTNLPGGINKTIEQFITANIDPKNQNIGQDHIQYLGAEIANLLFPRTPP